MQLQSTLAILALTFSATATAISAAAPVSEAIAAPADNLEARVTQLRWDAKKDGKVCSRSWRGVCFEHCVTEGTTSSKKCIRNTITSAIDGSGCGILSSRCKCVCNTK